LAYLTLPIAEQVIFNSKCEGRSYSIYFCF